MVVASALPPPAIVVSSRMRCRRRAAHRIPAPPLAQGLTSPRRRSCTGSDLRAAARSGIDRGCSGAPSSQARCCCPPVSRTTTPQRKRPRWRSSRAMRCRAGTHPDMGGERHKQ